MLLLLLIAQAHADQVNKGAAARFDASTVTAVYAAALGFMEPRTLEAVPVPQLTLWGLRGLTAIDPDLATDAYQGKLRLIEGGQLLSTETPPAQPTPLLWAAIAARLSSTAFAASSAIRQAGTAGVIQSFFDELFNHLDPYSRYVGPQEAALDRANRNGSAGLGLTLERRNNAVRVAAAVEDSPAATAGVQPGDIVLAVDGERVHGDAVRAERLIAGPNATAVRLSWRGKGGHMHVTELIRTMVPPETVFADRQKNILMIRVTGFDRSTAAHLGYALKRGMAADPPPDGIVLDLRDNRGGLLHEAVEAANELLPTGVVAYTIGRDPDASRIWLSGPGQLAQDVPVVVLVDGRTASAAEVLTAALTDRGRAVAVGSATLGKGLVQTITPLPNGGELFVTWSRILAPRGWPLQGLGVLPQVCTSLGGAALHKQLAALADGTQPMTAAIEAQRAARAPLPAATMVAIRRNCPAAGGNEDDMAAAKLLIENPAAYAAALLPPLQAPAAQAVR
ncbi:MAG TPA: S41 family peptidase [Acetobacteraceae bacterium]|nr:S41 family peptidase [Acetobacteraceae bacterium]